MSGPERVVASSSAWVPLGVLLAFAPACGSGSDRGTGDAGATGGGHDAGADAGGKGPDAGSTVYIAPAYDGGPPPDPCPDGGPCAQWENVTPPGVDIAYVAIQNYGLQSLAGAVPDAPQTLYLGTCDQGVYRTTDGANTWTKIDTGSFVNNDGTPYTAQGPGGNPVDSGRNWTMAVDPTDSNVVYTCPGYGFSQSLWKSTNGGVDWREMIGSAAATSSNSVYSIAIDPLDHLHLVLTLFSWMNSDANGDAGLLESHDGGESWTVHPPTGSPGGTPSAWGHGQYVFFVGQNDDGSPDIQGNTWIVTTQLDGVWRTDDGSQTWTQVATFDMTHGQESMYRSRSTGALFLGGIGDVYRSTDNGRHWSATGAQSDADGYGGIVGDGARIWAMLSNTGVSTQGPYRWQVLPEDDVTSSTASPHWSFYDDQTFQDGPMSMVFDPVHAVVYASMWSTGMWRLTL